MKLGLPYEEFIHGDILIGLSICLQKQIFSILNKNVSEVQFSFGVYKCIDLKFLLWDILVC